MDLDYEKLVSLTKEQFEQKMKPFDKSKATKSDPADLAKIEKLLDARQGLLANEEYWISKHVCQCGTLITFFDAVHTSLAQGHSKSFVLHTLLGSKYFVQAPMKVTCSECGHEDDEDPPQYFYECEQYGCCGW